MIMNTYMSEILNMLQDNHAEVNLLNIYDINPNDPLDNIEGFEKLENYFFHKYINYIQSIIKNKILTYDFSYQHDTGYIFNISLFCWSNCSGDMVNTDKRIISLYPYFGSNKMNFSSKNLVFIPDRYKDKDGNIIENHLQNRIVTFLEKIGFKVTVNRDFPYNNILLKIVIPDSLLLEINWFDTLKTIKNYKN